MKKKTEKVKAFGGAFASKHGFVGGVTPEMMAKRKEEVRQALFLDESADDIDESVEAYHSWNKRGGGITISWTWFFVGFFLVISFAMLLSIFIHPVPNL